MGDTTFEAPAPVAFGFLQVDESAWGNTVSDLLSTAIPSTVSDTRPTEP
eukprot:NODE_15398_length_186_cov_17.802920_g13628_i0.p5 GENE.NODE_15398_length_186_cov_17.802920_g13628_i0~~NODE_15398_length_186_cov_17.802920_g13628_i0.p5  ORF type:complete len:56 (+),score=27.49 NODE_15398_length_186_cov_17.802920_g13628_i0:22-168(+)